MAAALSAACAKCGRNFESAGSLRASCPRSVHELRPASQPLQGCETRSDSTPREIVSTRAIRANRFLLPVFDEGTGGDSRVRTGACFRSRESTSRRNKTRVSNVEMRCKCHIRHTSVSLSFKGPDVCLLSRALYRLLNDKLILHDLYLSYIKIYTSTSYVLQSWNTIYFSYINTALDENSPT